jgi:hypothetical protein
MKLRILLATGACLVAAAAFGCAQLQPGQSAQPGNTRPNAPTSTTPTQSGTQTTQPSNQPTNPNANPTQPGQTPATGVVPNQGGRQQGAPGEPLPTITNPGSNPSGTQQPTTPTQPTVPPSGPPNGRPPGK